MSAQQPEVRTRKLKVRCTFEIEVEVPDDPDYDAQWDLEENHDIGTGIVGAAFDEIYQAAMKNDTCWSCRLNGKCEIIKGEEHDAEKN